MGKTTAMLLALGLVLGACGGGSAERQEPTWRPSQRYANLSPHWWWEPVERTCEEDDDCREGETCNEVRLGTCRGCPRGENHSICVAREGDSATATRR
ncbi:MAG: hypothetical protein K8H88_29775 [Sandaracinaceae bacterium]|nr:hypothetical protein [Sandaracinaceae bacterium]